MKGIIGLLVLMVMAVLCIAMVGIGAVNADTSAESSFMADGREDNALANALELEERIAPSLLHVDEKMALHWEMESLSKSVNRCILATTDRAYIPSMRYYCGWQWQHEEGEVRKCI